MSYYRRPEEDEEPYSYRRRESRGRDDVRHGRSSYGERSYEDTRPRSRDDRRMEESELRDRSYSLSRPRSRSPHRYPSREEENPRLYHSRSAGYYHEEEEGHADRRRYSYVFFIIDMTFFFNPIDTYHFFHLGTLP
jgi:hypothetical protein